MKKSKTKLKINSSKNFGIADDKIKHFKKTFDDINGDSNRFNLPSSKGVSNKKITSSGKFNPVRDIHFRFAVVLNDMYGQVIHLFKQQKKAEEFLVKLKEW